LVSASSSSPYRENGGPEIEEIKHQLHLSPPVEELSSRRDVKRKALVPGTVISYYDMIGTVVEDDGGETLKVRNNEGDGAVKKLVPD
jgi:hypothetical protein